MKWGVRNDNHIPYSTKRLAKRDAKEYARAKMFYGEGAGNRRKLIGATVKQRSKDPYYEKEFNRYLEKQNMAKHASKARSERHRKDARKGIGELVGQAGGAIAVGTTIYGVGKRTGVDKKVAKVIQNTYRNVTNASNIHRGRQAAERFLRRNGL